MDDPDRWKLRAPLSAAGPRGNGVAATRRQRHGRCMPAEAMPSPPRDLVMVLAFDPLAGLLELDPRLAALKADAAVSGYPFDRHALRNELQAATFRLREPRHVRLLLGPTGAIAIEVGPDNSFHL